MKNSAASPKKTHYSYIPRTRIEESYLFFAAHVRCKKGEITISQRRLVYSMLNLISMLETCRVQMVAEVKMLRYGSSDAQPGMDLEQQGNLADDLQERIDTFEDTAKSIRNCVHIVLWKGGGREKADFYRALFTVRHMAGVVGKLRQER